MLAKNTGMSVATIAAALITGLLMALLLALMPAPAQAQSGDVLRLISIKCIDREDAGDDEAGIKVDGAIVWGHGETNMTNGNVVNLSSISVPLSGQSAQVQLWEWDDGHIDQHDLLGEFSAEYTDGTERTKVISFNSTFSSAVYEIKYVVERPPDTPPETAIDSGPTGTIFGNQAIFEFHANEPSTFQCKLDGGVFEPCSSPKVYSGLAFGPHSFEVRAIDSAGQVDPTPASRSWTAQQNLAPTITSPKPALGSTTRDRTPLISAVVKDAETELTQGNITLKVDGSVKSFAYDAVSDKLLRESSKLALGKHTVSITATDGLVNTTKTWSFKVVRR